jgi:hypothetical protein
MSYSGATAASSVANPPIQIARGLGGTILGSTTTGGGTGLWFYSSTNLTTDLTASNFFSDAYYIGMKQGDLVIGTQYTSAGSSTISFQGVVGAVSTSGASLSTGGTMTSTFS